MNIGVRPAAEKSATRVRLEEWISTGGERSRHQSEEKKPLG
jgi:hypothetical protein